MSHVLSSRVAAKLTMRDMLLCLFCFLSARRICGETPGNSTHRYEAIYIFGDSLSDTGNFLRTGALANPVIKKLPYGVTFFRSATGRCSDGRLVIDFLAEAFGLPYLPPYLALAEGEHVQHGVNFAVAGATALSSDFYFARVPDGTKPNLWTNDSLGVQLQWFKKYKSSICSTKQLECASQFKKSLFIVGEIGGNDYNYASFLRQDITKLKALVPLVVGTISQATSALIEEGARSLLVPGNLPMGCVGIYLTLFQSPNKADYNRHGCLKTYNAFARYHNSQLKLALGKLKEQHPQANIMYADFYGAATIFYHTPKHHGFSKGVLVACCGGGGPYNFNYTARCGHTGSTACKDPSKHANWDGIHLTEAAYKYIADGLLNGPFSSPNLKSVVS